MLFMGTTIDANEAYRIGLVNKVVPLDELMSTAKEWAAKICENGPIAVRLAKRAMLLGIDMTLEEGLKLESDNYPLFLDTEDLKEGLSAFAEKRKPVYKAR
jgi:enoyl-CoA hydratase/carnithine racemase